MEPLLENTQLRLRPYKKHETHKVFLSLLNPGMQRKVNSTTKRIVKRIIEDWWEKLCGGTHTGIFYTDHTNSPNLSHTSTLSSCSSTSTNNDPSTPDAVDEIATIIPRKDVEKKLLEQENKNNIVIV